MNPQFSKSQKNIARKVIETGLQRDIESSNRDIEKILQRLNSGVLIHQEAYHEIFGTVKRNDKYIARIYDNMKGSTYILIIRNLLTNKVLAEEDLQEFSEETRNDILGLRNKLLSVD
jgi:hypothetical protein